MLKRAAILIGILGSATALAMDDSAPQWRPDAVTAFGGVLCDANAGDLTVAAQAHGLYDGQIEGARLASRDGLPVPLDGAQMRGRSIARVKRYGGYAAGQCNDGSAWAAAFPSPARLEFRDSDIKLPISALQKQCSDWYIDVATDAEVKRLPATATVKTQGLDGTISVTCQPKRPRWQGPVVWYLVPVGQGPKAAPPHADLLALKSNPKPIEVATRLRTWINTVRADAKLQPISSHTHLDAQAELLAIDTSVAHDRLLLKRVAAGMGAQKLHFIGEDRARAADLPRVAWLLWNSPRHRALLLDQSATHAGIAIKEVRGETLAVILAAGSGSMTTAERAAAKKKL